MEEKKKTGNEGKKLSYPDLELAAHQLSEQARGLAEENKQLKMALQNANMTNLFTELNFKFKVLKYSNAFDESFVNKMAEDIKTIMLPEEKESEKSKEEK